MKPVKRNRAPPPWAELPRLLQKQAVHFGENTNCKYGKHQVMELEMWGFEPGENGTWVPTRRQKCKACREAAFSKLTQKKSTSFPPDEEKPSIPPGTWHRPTLEEVKKPEQHTDALATLLELAVVTGTYKGTAQALKGMRSSQAWRSYYWSKEKLAQSEAEFRAREGKP